MNPDELAELAEKTRAEHAAFNHHIVVCTGTACHSAGSEQIIEGLETEIKARGMTKTCRVTGGGCRGLCTVGPMVTLASDNIAFQRVKPDDAPALMDGLGSTSLSLLLWDTETPFNQRQSRIVLEINGLLDPRSIDDYIAMGGYATFLHVLTTGPPAKGVDVIDTSGLRRRGRVQDIDRP